MLYFFLSYAHSRSDHLVEAFFDDLTGEVREHAGCDRDDEVGFLDRRNLHIGDHWPPALIRALQECRTFVALCSPRYFRSIPCGKEWDVFARRLANDPAPGPPAPALVPLLWLPVDVPPHLTHLQYHDWSFGSAYREHGLRRLLRLRKHRDDYLEFVTSVAVRIVTTARSHHPPPLVPPPTFADAVNAFAAPVATSASTPKQRQRGRIAAPPTKLPLVSYDENRDENGHH